MLKQGKFIINIYKRPWDRENLWVVESGFSNKQKNVIHLPSMGGSNLMETIKKFINTTPEIESIIFDSNEQLKD